MSPLEHCELLQPYKSGEDYLIISHELVSTDGSVSF